MAATHSANGILPQRQFQLFFVRTPQSGPQEATLRLLSPFSLDGCVDITPPVVEQEQKGKTLWYTVSDPGITLQAPSAQKTQGCRQNARYAFADITFDRDNLQKQDIRQIAFKAGTQVDYYDLAVSDRNITLMPKSATAFQPRTGLLTQWFYPASMVILYVPSAKDQPDIARKVAALAQSHGMVDAEKALPGFHQPMADRNNFYFLDKKRAIVKTLTAENSQIVGTIEGEETFFGPHGPYQRPKMMDVFARRPGTND